AGGFSATTTASCMSLRGANGKPRSRTLPYRPSAEHPIASALALALRCSALRRHLRKRRRVRRWPIPTRRARREDAHLRREFLGVVEARGREQHDAGHRRGGRRNLRAAHGAEAPRDRVAAAACLLVLRELARERYRLL